MKGFIENIVSLFEAIPTSLITLLARIIIGLVFFNSGLTKIDGFAIKDSTFFLFSMEYNVPLVPPVVAAYMATFAELTMPLLLWVGLGARFAALALLGMTAVIQTFVYPAAYVTHGLWAVALLVIVRFGAGYFSIDQIIRSRHASPVPEAHEGDVMWKS
ncbi:MAG: DoxX family protein [Alphaproteobacteria bacterium]|nr:DoxX family protein [Alphaproteobacteria bacterium]